MKYTQVKGEEQLLFFSNGNKFDKVTGCIGHVRAYYDNRDNFWHSWFGHQEEMNTSQFAGDLKQIIDEMRENGPLAGMGEVNRFCQSHPDYALDRNFKDGAYGFKCESETNVYYFRLSPFIGDYNLYCYCYDKATLEQYLNPKNEPELK